VSMGTYGTEGASGATGYTKDQWVLWPVLFFGKG
jgi:hypothetical protein